MANPPLLKPPASFWGGTKPGITMFGSLIKNSIKNKTGISRSYFFAVYLLKLASVLTDRGKYLYLLIYFRFQFFYFPALFF